MPLTENLDMTSSHARTSPDARPGWVTRTYPVVLDRWPALTDMARVTAKILCSECEVGDVFTVRFADWIVHHFARPKRDEKAARDAFNLLEELGVLRVVGQKRGRFGFKLYQLLDPMIASQRTLGLAVEHPQQTFDFVREPADDDFVDRDGGLRVLRLFDPNNAGPNIDIQSDVGVGLNAERLIQSDARVGLNGGDPIQSDSHVGLNAAAMNASRGETEKTSAEVSPGESLARTPTTAAGEPRGEALRRIARRTESNTGQRIEAASAASRGDRSKQEAAACGAGFGPASPLTAAHDSDGAAAVEGRFGTRDASRAHASLDLILQEQEISPFNSNPNPYSNPKEPELEFPSSAPADVIGATDDWADAVTAARDERADREVRRLRQAVIAAESSAGIDRRDKRAMHSYVLDDWRAAIAAGDVSPQHVRELCDDLKAIDEWKTAPGALVRGRLLTLAPHAVRRRRAR